MADRMTAEELNALATVLWGEKWVQPMAERFAMHHNTIYAWRREGAPMDKITAALARYIIRQEAALDRARQVILLNA